MVRICPKNAVMAVTALWLTQDLVAAPKLDRCPEPDDLHHYIETPAFPQEPNRSQKMRIYYFLTKPFDPDKPTVVFLDGGPGGYTVLDEAATSDVHNSVYMHHRGVGCSTALFDHGAKFQEPLYKMSHAAHDLELIRQELLGRRGWFVYGRSYGSMLAQTYALHMGQGIKGLILDSTTYATEHTQGGREQLIALYIDENPEVQANYNMVSQRFPNLKTKVLRVVFWGSFGGYKVRVTHIPLIMEQVATAESLDAANSILDRYDFDPPPLMGMAREIGCREIYAYPESEEEIAIFAKGVDLDCQGFRTRRAPFNYLEKLKKLTTRTLIFGGKYDMATPMPAMRVMHREMPNALLWENPHAGHGLIREKPECAHVLIGQFARGASDQAIFETIDSLLCQSPPILDDQDQSSFKLLVTERYFK